MLFLLFLLFVLCANALPDLPEPPHHYRNGDVHHDAALPEGNQPEGVTHPNPPHAHTGNPTKEHTNNGHNGAFLFF